MTSGRTLPNKKQEPCHKQWLVARLAYSSTLKMEAVCTSKTSANYFQTMKNHFSENNIHGHQETSNSSYELCLIAISTVLYKQH
jgi:hypothetical protein